MQDKSDIWILGGGISGLSTAILLQQAGYKTSILSDLNFDVPTNYAMASAYPHNLKIQNLDQISEDSQNLFAKLAQNARSGLLIHRIYEVFEQEPELAPLGDKRMQFQTFDGPVEKLKMTIKPPFRTGATYLYGYTFKTYFADMPVYMDFLWDWYEALGGLLVHKKVTPEIIKEASGKIVVNCLGLGSLKVFEDKSPLNVVRGKQVLVPKAPIITGAENIPMAYNYTPSADVFSRADGNPEYVHFFSRNDGWLLGQTREPGSLDQTGKWVGDSVKGEEVMVGGVFIPEPILSLNNDLLKNWVGYDLKSKQTQMQGRVGLRYYRDSQNSGVRLELDNIDGVSCVHNYGHGGSGITMSWGCAKRCVDLVNSITGKFSNLSAVKNENF
ncbi:FAD-binding oxidoreductase [bacterium]|nr:FAD-binding oxidoreductase [bacterium]